MSREFPLRPIVGVGAIIFEGGRVLLAKRGKPPSPGNWSIPGGALELGETLEDACRREVMEETGLCVKIETIVGLSHFYRCEPWPDSNPGAPLHFHPE